MVARCAGRGPTRAPEQLTNAMALGGYGSASGRERSRKPSSSGSTRIPSKSWTFAPGTCGSTSAARRVLALWLCARPPRLATSSPRAKRSLVSARHLLACLLLHAFATGRPHDRSRAFSLHQGSHAQHLPTLSSNPLAIVCTLGPRPQSTAVTPRHRPADFRLFRGPAAPGDLLAPWRASAAFRIFSPFDELTSENKLIVTPAEDAVDRPPPRRDRGRR